VIVLDSSFLIGFHNERDADHQEASALMDRFLAGEWGRGLLLEYVFLEVATVLLLRRDLQAAARVGRLLLDAQELEFVPCSEFFLQAFERFTQQESTRLSLVDAAIAYVAQVHTDGLVLTFDQEFAKLQGIQIPTA
jgi:predicted nucleic acid-binding protein